MIPYSANRLGINFDNLPESYISYDNQGVINTLYVSAIRDGSYLFYGRPEVTGFIPSLNYLTIGDYMFSDTNISSFNIPLPEITSSNFMFAASMKQAMPLQTFDASMPKLTTARYMFYLCNRLTTFNNPLSKLTNGEGMFNHCENLTTFNSSLSSLENGLRMFSFCRLSASEINKILGTLPTVVSSVAKQYIISVDNNPGSHTCDTTIATSKGWGIQIDSN